MMALIATAAMGAVGGAAYLAGRYSYPKCCTQEDGDRGYLSGTQCLTPRVACVLD